MKEIFDKCWELKASGQDLMIFNQFEELGNPLWHYHVTGSAAEEALAGASAARRSRRAASSDPPARRERWAPATI